MFPWASEYDISSLPDYQEIRASLERAGAYAKSIVQRLTFHPGPFNKLPSEDPNVIKNTTRDLEIHGEIFDLLNLPQTPYAKINIHVGAAYDDKLKACKTFIKNFKALSPSVRSRLTVENDDKASLYSTRELYDLIYKEIGIPIVFDYHHHTFCDGGQSEQEALELAISTWNGITPVVHYSESRSLEQQDRTIKPQAHSDYVYKYINTYGHNIDIMIEAKHKELALLKYRELHKEKLTGEQ
jgi:UV DNA damage endonuclease